jgi:hypothetical protein
MATEVIRGMEVGPSSWETRHESNNEILKNHKVCLSGALHILSIMGKLFSNLDFLNASASNDSQQVLTRMLQEPLRVLATVFRTFYEP